MKPLGLLQMVLLLGVGFGLGRGWQWPGSTAGDPSNSTTTTTHLGLSIERIQPLSSLVTARVEVADVVQTTLSGYTGSIRAAILVKGDFLLGTDLSAARFEAVDERQHKARLILSQPAAASVRVDHERTRVYCMDARGLWQLTPWDTAAAAVINHAYADAQQRVLQAAGDRQLRLRAQNQAQSVLVAFFEALGWQVEICWKE